MSYEKPIKFFIKKAKEWDEKAKLKEMRKTPYGDLNLQEWKIVKMSCRVFNNQVSSGDHKEYEQARKLFANPVNYYKRDFTSSEQEKKLEAKQQKKKVKDWLRKRHQKDERAKRNKKFAEYNEKPEDAGSDFEYSFYGPVESDYESISGGEEEYRRNIVRMIQDKPRGYWMVSDEYRSDTQFRWDPSPKANRIRWFVLSGKLGSYSNTPLHVACKIGFKEMVTMIIIESKVMGQVKSLINKENRDALTPIYLLCEQGHKHAVQEEKEDLIEAPGEEAGGGFTTQGTMGRTPGDDHSSSMDKSKPSGSGTLKTDKETLSRMTGKMVKSKQSKPQSQNQAMYDAEKAGNMLSEISSNRSLEDQSPGYGEFNEGGTEDGDGEIQDGTEEPNIEEKEEEEEEEEEEEDEEEEEGEQKKKADVIDTLQQAKDGEFTAGRYGPKNQEELWGTTGPRELQYHQNNMRSFKDAECTKGSRVYILNLLLQHGANPNVQSAEVKHTPLHWLCFWGDYRAIKILLEFNHLGLAFGKRSDSQSFFEDNGAFNLFQTSDGATPVDIAGDLGKYKSVRTIIDHFLQKDQQKNIIDAFTEPWRFERFGQQRFNQQKTKTYINNPRKPGVRKIPNSYGFTAKNMKGLEIVISFAKPKSHYTKQQISFVSLAYWAQTMAGRSQEDKERALHILYILIMDLGVSPFVKCYDDIPLISGLVRSREYTIIRDLLKHKYLFINYSEFSYFKRQIFRSTDRFGNNILHEVYMLPEITRDVYLDIFDKNPMEVHFRNRDNLPLDPEIQKRFDEEIEFKVNKFYLGNSKNIRQRNKRAFAPYEIFHQQPVTLSRMVVDDDYRLAYLEKLRLDDDKQKKNDSEEETKKRTLIIIDASNSMTDKFENLKKYLCMFLNNIWTIIERHGFPPEETQVKISWFKSYRCNKDTIYGESTWEHSAKNLINFISRIKLDDDNEMYSKAVEIGLHEAIKEIEDQEGLNQIIIIGDAPANNYSQMRNQQNEGEGEYHWQTNFKDIAPAEALINKFYLPERVMIHTIALELKAEEGFKQISMISHGNSVQFDVNNADAKKASDLFTEFMATQILEEIGGKDLVNAFRSVHQEVQNSQQKTTYQVLKEIQEEQFQADFVIVTYKKKIETIKRQLKSDLNISKFNSKRDKVTPGLQRSVYFTYYNNPMLDEKPACRNCCRKWFKSCNCSPCLKQCRDTVDEKFKLQQEKHDQDEMYIGIKLCPKDIDKIAHKYKVYGDHKEFDIKCQSHNIMFDQFTAFDARQYYYCLTEYFESEMDLKAMQDYDIVKEYYPLHRSEMQKEIEAGLKQTDSMFGSFFYHNKWSHRCAEIFKCGPVHERKYLMRNIESIHLLKRYYGERYTFFYLFYTHYSTFLIIPVLIQIVIAIWQAGTFKPFYNEHYHFIDAWANTIFSFLVAIWGSFFVESWRRRENDFVHEWDLEIIKESVERETVRPEFKQVNKIHLDLIGDNVGATQTYDKDMDIVTAMPDSKENVKCHMKINWASVLWKLFIIGMVILNSVFIMLIESQSLFFHWTNGPFDELTEMFSHSGIEEVTTNIVSKQVHDGQLKEMSLINERIAKWGDKLETDDLMDFMNEQIDAELHKFNDIGSSTAEDDGIDESMDEKVDKMLAHFSDDNMKAYTEKLIQEIKDLIQTLIIILVQQVMAFIYVRGNLYMIKMSNVKYKQDYFDNLATSEFIFKAQNKYFPAMLLAFFVENPFRKIYFYLAQRILFDEFINGFLKPCALCTYNGWKLKKAYKRIDDYFNSLNERLQNAEDEYQEKMDEHEIAERLNQEKEVKKPEPIELTIEKQIEENRVRIDQQYNFVTAMVNIVMQFGFLVLFSNIFPYASIIFFVFNQFKLKILRAELLQNRREVPMIYFGVGIFVDIIDMLSYMGLFINMIFAFFYSESFSWQIQNEFIEMFGEKRSFLGFEIGLQTYSRLAATVTLYVVGEHLLFLFKVFLRMEYQDPMIFTHPIIRRKNKAERLFAREKFRQAFNDKFEKRKRAYEYVQQQLILAKDQGVDGERRTGGQRIDYMYNHYKYKALGKAKQFTNQHVIEFKVYQEAEKVIKNEKQMLLQQLRQNIRENC